MGSQGQLGALRRGLAIAACVSLAWPAAVAGQEVGIASAIRNAVQVRRAPAPPRPAVLRQRMAMADEVRTGAASQLQIMFLDRSVFTVGANARVTIDRFIYDPRRSSRAMGASVTRGAFRYISGRAVVGRSDSRRVRTPVATIGIRGTIVDGVVGDDAIRIASADPAAAAAAGADPETATLIVLRGPGPQAAEVRPGAVDIVAGDRTITLDRPGLALYFPAVGAAPIGPFELSEAGLVQVQQLMLPPPTALPFLAGTALTVPDLFAELGVPTAPGEPGVADEGEAARSRSLIRSIGDWLPALFAAIAGGLIVVLDDENRPTSP